MKKSIREQREELNLSQQDVAVMLNVSRVTYIKWEQDTDSMTVGKYKELTREFRRLRKIRKDSK